MLLIHQQRGHRHVACLRVNGLFLDILATEKDFRPVSSSLESYNHVKTLGFFALF